MGILMALPEIIIEVAAAAAEVAAEAAAAAAEVAAEAAIDAAIDAGVEGAVSATVEAGTDAALDAGLDAAIDGTAAQIARTAGGQAMKKLVDKVGSDAAKRVVNAVKDQIKDGVKDQAKQDLKDYINGKKQPPPAPQTVPVPPAPPGVDIDHPTIDQFVAVENYFKAVHGSFVQARQNENLDQMRTFGPTATHVLAGMVNLRQQNFVSFRLKEFDADLGTGSYNEALTVYNGVVTKLLPNLTNEELNATFDPVKDDLQNKINTAITNTYVPPDVPGPDLTKYRGLKYPLQDPNDYPIILDALKQSNTAFRAAFNVSNKVKMIEYGLDMSECCRDGIAIRKSTQATFDAVEVDGPAATASWEKLETYWSSVQQNLNFQSNHDDVNKIVGAQLDEANGWLNTMLSQTNTATPEQSQAKRQKAQQGPQQQQAQQQTQQQGQQGAGQQSQQLGKFQGRQPNQSQLQQPNQPQLQQPNQSQGKQPATTGATQTTAAPQSYAYYAASKLAPHAANALAPHAAKAGTYVAGKLASHAMSTMMPSLAASTQQQGQQKTAAGQGQGPAKTQAQQQATAKA